MQTERNRLATLIDRSPWDGMELDRLNRAIASYFKEHPMKIRVYVRFTANGKTLERTETFTRSSTSEALLEMQMILETIYSTAPDLHVTRSKSWVVEYT